VEEYSKTNELKSQEIQDLLAQALIKKQKHTQLKKAATELEQKVLRYQSKLDNMTKFCKIFIKSIKNQNQSLQDTVKQQQSEIINVF
jgi:uncharacterized membrane-anchored protein YjiN (DUF445 family)